MDNTTINKEKQALDLTSLMKELPPSLERNETNVKSKIPDELVCSLCNDLIEDAVIVPCCTECYCYECIRNHLLERNHECPKCHEKDIPPTNLVPTRFTRGLVNKFKRETGYSKPKTSVTGASPPEVMQKPPVAPFNPVLPKTDDQLAPQITRPMESPPPGVEVPEADATKRTTLSLVPNGGPTISGNVACENIQRDGGPPPLQQQQHWGQQPHIPPNVSPQFCPTQLSLGPPLGHESFCKVQPPGYLPIQQNNYSWQSYPEMWDDTQNAYYYEGPQPPMDYGYAASGPATYAQNQPYRMDEPFREGQDEPKKQRMIEDPLEEFERIMAEKDARKMAHQITGRRRPRSRSISPAPTRTSRYYPERSQSRRRRSFSRSPSPKRRRSYSKRRDGKSSRSPSKNPSSSPRQGKRNFDVAGHDDKRKEKRTHSFSSNSHHKKERKDRKEKRKEESKRRSRH